MTPEARIRNSVDAALDDLSARVDKDVRALVDELVRAALKEREDALSALRDEAHVRAVRDAEERSAAESRLQAAMALSAAAVTRLLAAIRALDAAGSLSEVLDALGDAAAREASRAAVFVLRHDRLLGWKLTGFDESDAQPKSVELGLSESGVFALAVSTARPATTREVESGPSGPVFAHLPSDRIGVAVPVIVGGRVVAVVYADTATVGSTEHGISSGWPDLIEVLTRHASRCLEALTVQKVAAAATPRFWVPASGRPTQTARAPETIAASAPSATPTESDATQAYVHER